MAAQLAGMHPQTLRTYDRMGLVSPRRTAKRGRRYSARDIARAPADAAALQDEGINLEGIRRILAMQDEIDELRARVERADPAARRRSRRPWITPIHRRSHRRRASWSSRPANTSRSSWPPVSPERFVQSFERIRCRLRTSCSRKCRSDAFSTFGSPESFAYCLPETVRSKTARGKPGPGVGNLHSASYFQLIATERNSTNGHTMRQRLLCGAHAGAQQRTPHAS